jgi:hypothetical protein
MTTNILGIRLDISTIFLSSSIHCGIFSLSLSLHDANTLGRYTRKPLEATVAIISNAERQERPRQPRPHSPLATPSAIRHPSSSTNNPLLSIPNRTASSPAPRTAHPAKPAFLSTCTRPYSCNLCCTSGPPGLRNKSCPPRESSYRSAALTRMLRSL